MTPQQKQVLEFMELFQKDKLPKPTSPIMLGGDTWQLCLNLIEEEWTELYDSVTLEERMDAFADLLYVIHFAINASGVDIEPIQLEVHRSNMTKLWTDAELKSKVYDGSFMTVETAVGDFGDRKFIVRNDEGKVIKSPSYSPANLKPIIDLQLNANH